MSGPAGAARPRPPARPQDGAAREDEPQAVADPLTADVARAEAADRPAEMSTDLVPVDPHAAEVVPAGEPAAEVVPAGGTGPVAAAVSAGNAAAGGSGADRPDPRPVDPETARARALAAAVAAVPGVAGLAPDPAVATYLPGGRISGLRLAADRTEVHLVLAWDHPAEAVVGAVRQAVSAVRSGPVDVTVADVALPGVGTGA